MPWKLESVSGLPPLERRVVLRVGDDQEALLAERDKLQEESLLERSMSELRYAVNAE